MADRKRLEFDPKGFFYIYVKRGPGGAKIVVEHYLNVKKAGSGRYVDTGRINKVLEGSRAEDLSRQVLELGLVSRLDHAMYLGRELARAQAALESGDEYEQDGGERWS